MRELPSSSKATPLDHLEILGGGDRPPLIYLHCWPGDVANAHNLARGLVDRPVISIPRPTAPNGRAPTVFKEWVRHYNDSIEGLQLDGPIYLAGWSMAFRFAIEVAAERRQLGQRTDLLVSFDGNGSKALQEQLQTANGRHASPGNQETSPFLRAIGLRRRNRRYLQARAYRLVPLGLRHAMGRHWPESDLWHPSREHVSALKVASFHNRDDRRRSDVPAIVFATASSQARMGDEALGLATQLAGPIEVIPVPGRHLTLLDEINGPAVAEAARLALNQFDEAVVGRSAPQVEPAEEEAT